jgi:group I intron endonuclease
MNRISGVYLIVNNANGRVYVGSSVNITARWCGHKRALSQGKSPCVKLQRAWDKYGESSFSFQVIEHVAPQKELLIEAEQRWLDLYQSFDTGYNTLKKAYSHLGAKRSPESREKLSNSLKKRFADPDVRKRMSDAAKKRGVSEAFLNAQPGKISAEKLEKMRQRMLVTYILTSPTGEDILVENIHEFCEKNNLNEGSLRCVLHGQYRHYKGWRIRWKDEPSRDDGSPYVISKSYICTSPDGVEFKTENLKEFCILHGLARNAMAAVASSTSRAKTHRGWKCVKHEVLAVSCYTTA